MKLTLPKIGIVGGAGPMAGLLLCQKIVQLCQEKYGCSQDADFPYIMLLNYPFADMLALDQSQAHKNLIRKQLNECFDTFISHGIALSAIACNTLHAYLDFQSALEIVHIMKETDRLLVEEKIQHSLVLCSSTSAKSLIHQAYLNCCYPPDEWQVEVDDLIDCILTGKETVHDVYQLIRSIRSFCSTLSLSQDESFGIVLGCTEFSLLNEKWPLSTFGLNRRWKVVDSTQALAEELCKILFNQINQN